MAHKSGRDTRLISRTENDHTARFPDVAATIGRLSARSLILDGELAAFDERLVSRFDWLLDAPAQVIATPPVYVAFDCLAVTGRDFRVRPLHERRDVLADLLGDSDVFAVRRLADDGLEAWAEVGRQEGRLQRWQGPLEGSVIRGAPRSCSQGCAGAVAEDGQESVNSPRAGRARRSWRYPGSSSVEECHALRQSLWRPGRGSL